MPKYKCENGYCESYNKVDSVYGTKIRIEQGIAVDINSKCPGCGEFRVVVREAGMTTMISGTNDQRLRMERQ